MAPNLAILNPPNLWVWFRLQLDGQHDEKNWLAESWQEVCGSLRRNLTVALMVLGRNSARGSR
jgi:hypothetical protein